MDPDVMFPLIIFGMFMLVLISTVVHAYNQMVELRQRANQAFADMDAFLKKRRDLIPNLVATVKGSSAHENQVLTNVIRLRASADAATSMHQKLTTEHELSGALGQIVALGEAYPDLKANANFLHLQGQLGGIESEVSDARQIYNFQTASYNSERQKIPMVFFASALGFAPYEFFDVGREERLALDTPPSVQF